MCVYVGCVSECVCVCACVCACACACACVCVSHTHTHMRTHTYTDCNIQHILMYMDNSCQQQQQLKEHYCIHTTHQDSSLADTCHLC